MQPPERIPTVSAHPLQERENLLSCVRLLDAQKLFQLASPVPRSQDLPAEYFSAPSSMVDQVISVSHAWRNQGHPDPTGQKMKLLGQLVSHISTGNGRDQRDPQHQSILLFFDFLSIPQRPFCPGQRERTVEEVEMFKSAIECMHEMFFFSDRIIHLPWEDGDVPGEGVEETVPAASLEGASVVQIGESVQISRQSREKMHARSSRRVSLFDQVVSVDGEIIKSSTQLKSLLAANPQIATVRHFPFGNHSTIPADRRGWVFLERFITMVKCAMIDKEMAKNVVVTPSSAIFQQIMQGAHLLREASVRETRHKKPGELKQVLDRFIVEMQSKQFSATSTDKHESSAASKVDDQFVVSKIMQHFVEHLATHWQAEAAKQRTRGSRLHKVASVAEMYLVEWECFSEDYAATLTRASTAEPWPVAMLILVPLALVVPSFLWPYPSPDAGWASQGAFWTLGVVVLAFPSFCFIPVWLARTTKMVYSRNTRLLHVAWAATNTIVYVAMGVSVSALWQTFPVPLVSFLTPPIWAATLPVLWWCVPKEQRASSQFKRRFLASIACVVVLGNVYSLAMPLVNGAIPVVNEFWHPLLVSCYLAVKLMTELVALKFSKVLGADSMPNFVFSATFAYQLNLCIAFSKVNSWFLVAEQICFDVIENAYHLYTLFRQDPAARHIGLKEQYIVVSLVLREFLEVVGPAMFLIIHELIRAIRPENSVLFCDRSEQEVQRTVNFLVVAITAELVGSSVTYAILRHRQHAPLLLLRGVIATLLDCFLLTVCTALTYYCCMLHSHWGMDMSLTFPWVRDSDATWRCGLTWAETSQPGWR